MPKSWWNDKAFTKKVKDKILTKKLIMVGFEVERMAKRLAPVDTGRLRASISTNWSGSGMGNAKVGAKASTSALKGKKGKAKLGMAVVGVGQPGKKGNPVVVVGTNVEYSSAVEFGGSNRKAQPFLRPALRQATAFAKKLFKQ